VGRGNSEEIRHFGKKDRTTEQKSKSLVEEKTDHGETPSWRQKGRRKARKEGSCGRRHQPLRHGKETRDDQPERRDVNLGAARENRPCSERERKRESASREHSETLTRWLVGRKNSSRVGGGRTSKRQSPSTVNENIAGGEQIACTDQYCIQGKLAGNTSLEKRRQAKCQGRPYPNPRAVPRGDEALKFRSLLAR